MDSSSLLEEVNAALTKMSDELRNEEYIHHPDIRFVPDATRKPPQQNNWDHNGEQSPPTAASNSDYFDLQQKTDSMTDTESSDPDEAESADEQTEDGGDSEDYYRRVTVSGYEDNIDGDATTHDDCTEANTLTEGAESGSESETDTLLDHSEQHGK